MSLDDMAPPDPSPAPDRAPGRHPTLDALQERLGLPLVDAALGLSALTHKSFVNEHRGEGLQDNERLEFLGDAVIDLAVSHRLMERFPEAREGELSKLRAALVDEAALAQLARTLDLGALLRLGRGEELTGGRQKSSLLADALEAVVAALYLEGGLAPVLALVDRLLAEAFAQAAAGGLDRDYKTQLQEQAQSRMRTSPRYRVVAEHGPDHSKIFDVELELRGEVVGRGAGRSKKDAEQAAAKLGLEWMSERAAAEAAQAALASAAPGSQPEPEPEREPGPPPAPEREPGPPPPAQQEPGPSPKPDVAASAPAGATQVVEPPEPPEVPAAPPARRSPRKAPARTAPASARPRKARSGPARPRARKPAGR